jgi:TRAP-type C4-dicarboxylate transport system permease small subunit
MKPMKVISAWIQVIFVLLIVGYGTWQLFEGHLQESFSTLPLLFTYYIFVVGRLKRRQDRSIQD